MTISTRRKRLIESVDNSGRSGKKDDIMNTTKNSTKSILIIITAALVAVFAIGVVLLLPNNGNSQSDVAVTKTTITQQYVYGTHVVIASTREKADAYAEKLGLPSGAYDFESASGALNIVDGVLQGVKNALFKGKFAHLLLPNEVTTIDITVTSVVENPLGLSIVNWVSLMADEGSNLSTFIGEATANSASSIGGAYLTRVDLSKATKLTSLPDFIFKSDRLQHIALPENLSSMGEQSISSKSINHLSLPSGLGADGSGLKSNSFQECENLVEIELPSNANDSFINKIKSMNTVCDAYMNIYVKGKGRSWLARTVDGFVFCKNILRTTYLATGLASNEQYQINKWYMVGYQGTESEGDAAFSSKVYMVTLPTQIDLAKNSSSRAGQFDYVDCSGAELQNDFSSFTAQSEVGSNVSVNGAVKNNDAAGKRIIAGTLSDGTKLRYDINTNAFHFKWIGHATIPDGAVSVIGNRAFIEAAVFTLNIGDVQKIGNQGLALLAQTQGGNVTFYLPSTNPEIASDGFSYARWGNQNRKRLFVYRNYENYNKYHNKATSGLQKAADDFATGEGKYYSYLVNIVPNVAEWDESANAYKYTAVNEETMQRLYTGTLSGFNADFYNNGFSYVRGANDEWTNTEASFPAFTEYTGYSKTNWFTDTTFNTKYTEETISTSANGSAIASLRNAENKGIDEINIYSKKIVSFDLENKERTYTDGSLNEKSPEITGIPSSTINDYTISVSYVDSNGVAKTYESIGKKIQEAGIYTLQVRPDEKFGEWDATDIPTMTVTVKKATIDLGDYDVFRLGVTSDGINLLSFRPGKEDGEKKTTLYYYVETGSWYTSPQAGISESYTRTKANLWDSYIRAEGSVGFSLTRISPMVKDKYDNSVDVFKCTFSNAKKSNSGEYTENFTVELTDKAKNNYQFYVTNDETRQFHGFVNEGVATITKTWYIVQLNNWLTNSDYVGDMSNSPSFSMATEWEFGLDKDDPETKKLFKEPKIALGEDKAEITFNLSLSSSNLIGETEFFSNVPLSEYYKYINSSLPVGSYKIVFNVKFPEGEMYDTFQQSYEFKVTEKDFTTKEMNAIEALVNQTFEYDEKEIPKAYSDNGTLFDFDKINDPDGRLEDMLGRNNETWGKTPRDGIWGNERYKKYFSNNFEITYNLNRMWNNTYSTLDDLLKECSMDTPDEYIVYFQLTAKNRKSLISETNDADRRSYYFTIIVYKTMTAPKIEDFTYNGLEIFPTLSYQGEALASESIYYSVALPSGQDNVNQGKKKAIFTIDDNYYQLYRFAANDDTPQSRKFTKTIEIEYKINPATNSSIERLYIADWSWGSEIKKSDIIWQTQFGNNRDDFTFSLIADADNKEYALDEFKVAPAGKYVLKASCPADADKGNWLAFIDTREITISAAVNIWKKSPSISTWTWNQYENFNWDEAGAISPIKLHAIPKYYTASEETTAGSGRFDFRIYSIDNNESGNAKYKMVYFDDDEQEFHFQFAKDGNGDFIKDAEGHFVLPINVAKRLAELDAGQYYLVATVYSTNNYTGLNNDINSFLEGAVPFTIGSANNVWSDTISTADWTYSEFELGRHIYTGKTKYKTQLTYAIYDKNKTGVISVLGKELKGITDFTAIALTKDGKEYTYAELVNMLAVGSYTLTVHGDADGENARGGINFLAIDDERKVSVNKALNTLTETFVINDFTIGGEVDMKEFTARFNSDKVGYRISQSGQYIDDNKATSTNPIKFDNSWSYAKLLEEIKKLSSSTSGRNDYTVWYVTTEGENYAAQSGSETFAVFLGQNDWLNGKTPEVSGWTYDKTAHNFDKSGISLIHEVEKSLIEITYHDAVSNIESGLPEVGPLLSGCPINTGTYYIKITVPTDSFYKGMSIDLPFQISKADNEFETVPQIKNNGWVYSYLTIDDIIKGAAKNEEDGMQIQCVVSGDVSGVDFRYATLNWMLGSTVDQSNNEILLNAFYSRLNTLDVGPYKMKITLTESRNYNAKTLADVALTVTKATNGWQDGKSPIIDSTTKWQWNNYSDSVWKDIATKFGELTIKINDNEVAYSAVSRYLSTLEVGTHKIKFIVNETNNYSGFEEERTFYVTQNTNGWKDGEKDTTAYVDDWTWGEYNNGFAGTKHIWEQPAPKLGTPYATLYKGKDGVGGTLIASNIALYSLDIIMNGLDAGSYYIVWTVAEDKNYKSLTREYINFEVKVNDNKWLTPPTMHENDKKASSGIDYGWSWGTYHDDDGVYFTVPKARYGIVEAKIIKSKTTNIWSDPEVIIEGISNEVNIDNTLSRLDVGRYRIVWKAADPQNTGNYKVIEYEEIEFIVNRGVNTWTDGNPHIEGWQWGAYNDDLWQAPTLQSGYPNARVIKLNEDGTDGETVITKSAPNLLGAQLEKLEVGKYRILWTAEDDDNTAITGENPEELKFEVSVNKNAWLRAPKISATDEEWQWKTFTLAYWQRPLAKYYDETSDTPIIVEVYKLNEGCDFEYNALTQKYILDESKCSLVEGITLDTIDGINNFSVGKYLIKVSVSKDKVYGRYLGLETILKFTVVPNDNKFTSDWCYVNDYAYLEFRGYWNAPTSQFGDVIASVYRMENGVRISKLAEVGTSELTDTLKDLRSGKYELDWTIVADAKGNYLGGQKITNAFTVEKANNRWTIRPTIKDWTWGSYDSSIIPMATPMVSGSEPVYFKIVDADGEIASFREYAARFTMNANGDYYDDGLVLTHDGYFTNIAKVEEVVKNLKPGIYHLLAIYPEMEDYYRLDKNNDSIFEVKYAENKWVDLPQIDNWFYGSPVNLPTATSAYGTVKYTYYKAVYDEALGKYRIDGEAISSGENPPDKIGQYILVASAEAVDGYGPLYAEVFFEIYDRYSITGVSGNLLVWIDISLATIASITTAVIIYQLLKARSKNDDEIFNG